MTLPENDRSHPVPFNRTFDMVAGQKVQFLIDWGPRAGYRDFVALDATITVARIDDPFPPCFASAAMDFDGNCVVNTGDLAAWAEQWLECGWEFTELCVQ